MSNQSFKVKNGLTLTPVDLTTILSPQAGDLACDINDSNKIKQYDIDTSAWTKVGSGAASLDTIFQLVGDDVSTWITGNNASFLGGGTISGTFAKETVSPLNGPSSYKYTQAAGSLNDYIASSVQTVANRFKGQNCIISFPFNYNGSNSDIELVIYDVTNASVIPSSFFLEGSSNTKIFTGYITIPVTCSSIRVGFKVAVANSGKILNFDDIQLSQTSLYVPQPDFAHGRLSGRNTVSSGLMVFDTINENFGNGIFNINTSLVYHRIVILKNCYIDINYGTGSQSISNNSYQIQLRRNGISIAESQPGDAGTGNIPAPFVAFSGRADVGDIFTFSAPAAAPAYGDPTVYANFKATALSDQILTAPETFSSDTASFTYANAATYTLSTLANAPVGTFITYTYAASSNTRTQTTTAPTQTTADMNVNGMLIYTRAFNASSTAAQPAAIAIQIGKGLKGKSLDLYRAVGKVDAGSIDNLILSVNTIEHGFAFKEYNEVTGILLMDAAYSYAAGNTVREFLFSSIATQTSGYLVINASKNPALTGLNVLQPRIATLSEQYVSGIGSQTTVASYSARRLNTLSGDTSFIVNSGSFTGTGGTATQVVLQAGTYSVDFATQIIRTNTTGILSSKMRLQNITAGATLLIGTSAQDNNTSGGQNDVSSCILKGTFSISSESTIELQQRANVAGEPFGIAVSFGDNEVYLVGSIQKIK